MTLYLDTNILIYLLEGIEPFATRIADILEAHSRSGGGLVTSVVTITEFGAVTKSTSLWALYQIPGMQFIPLDEVIAEKAARLQRTAKMTFGDALHLATALHAKASQFMTNDSQFANITREHLPVLAM